MTSLRESGARIFAPAAPGTRVKVVTTSLAVVVLGAAIVLAWVLPGTYEERRVAIAASVALLGSFGMYGYLARIREYRLIDGRLEIVRRLLTKAFPLAGLVSATPDPQAPAGAWKVFGNDGLAAIAGRFRSRKLGSFNAYVTDPQKAVILRWPNRLLILSPQDPPALVDAIQALMLAKNSP